MADSIPVSALADRIGATVHGDGERLIRRAAALEHAGPDALAFCSGPAYARALRDTRAGAVIVPESLRETAPNTATILVVRQPYTAYARAAQTLHPLPPPTPGAHPSAVVADDVVVGSECSIGATAVVEAGATLGARVVIGPGCWVGPGARIDDDTQLGAHVALGAECRIGRRGIIHPGAVVGADGFGFAPDEEGIGWLKVPQLGAVRIDDDVEIGANVTIDRGAQSDTVIEEGVKLDDQVHIAHNVRVGAHTVIAGSTVVAGSTRIGKRCVIGGLTAITGHIEIADGTTLMGMTGVTGSIREAGTYASPLPARPAREWRRNTVRFTQLDELFRRVQALERQQGAEPSQEPGPEEG